jgi:anaerobic selenocysteine-containing dehydrogenase
LTAYEFSLGLVGSELCIRDRDWAGLRADYGRIRSHIERVVPGFEDYETRVTRPGGFVLPHPPRDSRTFTTPSGRAQFTASTIDLLEVPPGHLVLQTLRSHDQFNTTIYGLSDRYRGIEGGRHVVMVNARDIEALGLRPDQLVDIVAHWEGDDLERRVRGFRLVGYDTPRGTAAAYYPETNPLVPLGSAALESNTPTSKSVIVRLEPAQHDPR